RLLRLGKSLKIAGLNDMNVSLDAVEFDIFKRINRSLKLREVLEGIDLCISLGINIKINCTIQNTINDSQILPVLEWGKERGLSVRFLELMKMGHIQNSHDTFYLPGNEIIKRISKKYKLIELGREKSSTSKYWQIENSIRVGIISNHSDPFCSDCDRLRMDHKGYIFGCLSSPVSFPIDGKIPLEEVLERAMSLKRKKDFTGSTLSMKKIGG
ncbi:MAG: molybdenum cofactor biosynthesis protein MoeA, partial [Leptospiraceae bacterium]|nr:molybdenum cofactor biosynthesis protein MoeA [Leptospiraceae bacterium]